MANASSAANSKARWPTKVVLASSQLMSRPRLAQIGAAMPASLSVVNSEFQAVPAQTSPSTPHCRSKAVRKCASVGV